tara:strand:+ start:1089 stop:1316 length:228 start_codon:yes stop_codon:yes gene_type:complete
MQKNYFHNNKQTNENKNYKELLPSFIENTKRVVDINILLNRVKIERKNEIKRKILFFSFTTSAITLFGAFITIIK